MHKILIVILSLLLTFNIVQAQENGLNFGLTYDKYIGEEAGSGHLKGFRFSYEQVKQQFGRSGSWRIGFKYSFGDYLNNYQGVKNKSSNFNNGNSVSLPNTIEVDGLTSYKSLQFELNQKMYLRSGNIQYGGAYILVGFGVNITKHETVYTYDRGNYSVIDKKENDQDYIRQFACNFGGGYEFSMEFANIFIEGDFNIPFFAIHDDDLFEFEFRKSGHKFWSLSIGTRIHLFH